MRCRPRSTRQPNADLRRRGSPRSKPAAPDLSACVRRAIHPCHSRALRPCRGRDGQRRRRCASARRPACPRPCSERPCPCRRLPGCDTRLACHPPDQRSACRQRRRDPTTRRPIPQPERGDGTAPGPRSRPPRRSRHDASCACGPRRSRGSGRPERISNRRSRSSVR